MDIFYWVLIIAMFVVSFIGLVYPLIPGILFLSGGYLLYGLFFGFEKLTILFWVIQIALGLFLFVADHAANTVSIKKYGGSKFAIWGSIVGILIGPFIIPFAGIIVGPFLGAVLGEMLFMKQNIKDALKSGYGTILGFFGGVLLKGIIQIVMLTSFFLTIK